MTFINTIPPSKANGVVLAMYARQQRAYGYVPNYAKVFCHRPELMTHWATLLGVIRKPMTARRFELVTLAAAAAMNSSYCSLAHGAVMSNLIEPEAIGAIASGSSHASLGDEEQALIAFARKIALDASTITIEDVEILREHGVSDVEIFDIAAVVAARSFFTKLLDALGVEPDAPFGVMTETLRQSLTVGRAISNSPVESITAGDGRELPVSNPKPASQVDTNGVLTLY
jgi:uncharacterized peroxidase-related enzyme